MNFEPDQQLERLIQEELQKLPELKAPATLIGRVNARIRANAPKVWWQTSWLTWPPAMKVISALLFATLLGGARASLSGINPAHYSATARGAASWFTESWQCIFSLINAVVVVGRALGDHFLVWTLLLFGVLAVVTMALGSGLWRLIFREQQEE